MKRKILVLGFSVLMFISNNLKAQNSIEGILDKVVALAGSKGEASQIVNLLGNGASMLEKEASTGSSDLKSKLLGQVGAIKGLIPLASAGRLDMGSLGKIVNTIKMLVAANRIKSMLGGGKSSLLSNVGGLTQNLDLLKAGSSVLGTGVQKNVGKLLGSATKSVGKLNKSGLAGKMAATATDKKLNKLVSLVSSAL
jgi:hypothetical protein